MTEGADGAVVPNEKDFGISFGVLDPSLGGETDTMGTTGSGATPKENGLAAGASAFAGWAVTGVGSDVLEAAGKENPVVNPNTGVEGFVGSGAVAKLNPGEDAVAGGLGPGTTVGTGTGSGAEPKENGESTAGFASGMDGALGTATGAGFKGPRTNGTD